MTQPKNTANLRDQVAAGFAAAALALAAQVPFFRVTDAAVPFSLIAVNGAAILLYCVVTALIARRSLAVWAAILLVSPVAFALVPRIESRTESLTLIVVFAIVVIGSGLLARVMKRGAAPLVAAPVGSFLGGLLVWFQIEHFHGISALEFSAVAALGLVGLASIAVVLWAGRVAAFARLPKLGISFTVALFALSPAFLIGVVDIEKTPFVPPSGVRAGADSPPPVVLIVLDTLRVDHLAAYGYSRDTMPALERFFRQHGLSPIRSVANSPWSLSSHASIFTGLYPPRHGAHLTFVDDPDPPTDFPPLREKSSTGETMPTMAELLADAGYWTVGIAGNFGPLAPSYGLGRGFHEYSASKNPVHSMRARTPWRLATNNRWHAAPLSRIPPFSATSFFEPDVPYRRADEITDSAIQIIENAQDRAVFLFVNYIDAHSPYFPPEPYAHHFEGVQDDMPIPIKSAHYRDIVYTKKQSVPQSQIDHVTALYDGELRFMDSQLERLFARLQQHPRFDEMLIIVTSDHGEALGDHDDFGHTLSLYREQLEVPLFIKLGSGGAQGSPGTVMQSVDLFPLVLAHAGVETPTGIDGLAWGKQRDELLSWLYVFRTAVEFFDPSFNRELRSVERDGFKLVESTSELPQLFDVRKDSLELDDLYATNADRAGEMLASLGPRSSFTKVDGAAPRQTSKETLDQLQLLGYVQ